MLAGPKISRAHLLVLDAIRELHAVDTDHLPEDAYGLYDDALSDLRYASKRLMALEDKGV